MKSRGVGLARPLARSTRSRIDCVPETFANSSSVISSRAAARLLGVSQPTLNRAVREGKLRPAAVTPGGHRRFATSELLDALRNAPAFPATSIWSGC